MLCGQTWQASQRAFAAGSSRATSNKRSSLNRVTAGVV